MLVILLFQLAFVIISYFVMGELLVLSLIRPSIIFAMVTAFGQIVIVTAFGQIVIVTAFGQILNLIVFEDDLISIF